MALTRTLAETLMKELYTDDDLERGVVRNHPLLQLLQKDATLEFSGRYWYVPVMYTNTQGASFDAATAEANEVASKQAAFQVRPVTLYQYPKIAGSVVRASKSSKNSAQLINAYKSQVDSSLRNMGTRMGRSAYGNAGGSLARVSSTTAPSGNTLTLANPEDTVFFEPGMVIAASANDGTSSGHSLLDSGDTITIVSVDRVNGTLSGSAAWSGISGIAVGNYLFAKGDFQSAASGLGGWCPTTAPTSGDSFNSVDRSVEAVRLGGQRYDGSSESFETVFIKAAAQAYREGLVFDKIMINPTSNAALVIAKEGQKEVVEDEYGIGIEVIRYGNAKFVVDPDCPKGLAYAIGADAFRMASLGKVPHIGDEDGNQVRLGSADNFSLQIVADYNFISPYPKDLMVITLPTG